MPPLTLGTNMGAGAPSSAICFRRSGMASLRPSLPRSPAFAPHSRSRGRLTAQARFRRGKQEPEEEEEQPEESKTGLFSGLFGAKTGTQRLKAGQQEDDESPTPSRGRRSSPASKKSAPESKRSAPSFLQTTRIGRKDQNTVFVAGATGRLGLRIVRELLNAGFKVRAGARNTEKAQGFVDSALSLGLLSGDSVKRLQIVPVDLEDEGSISAALGNATRVVQAIGASETNVLDIGGPKRIDNQAAVALVDASVEAGVTQYVMVTSLGTEKFGWPASVLNLFGGILSQKRKAEKALEASGLNFTIVRPGGMERPGDDYKKENNVRLSTKNKLFGGQVSRLQVSELITSVVINPELAENQTYEVVAEKTAPKVDYEDLLRNFGSPEPVAEPETEIEEEEPAQRAPPPRPSRPPKRAAPKRPAPKQSASAELSGNQDAIAEDIARKEIDMKLKKDVPEPSVESQNVAEDIAKAEINIDSGKEKSTKSWFGLGGKSKGAEKEPSEDSAPSTSEQNPVKAVQKTVEKTVQPVLKDSPEEVERLRAAREKTAQSRAQREAEFLANLETQRQEALAKAKAARDKREQEALEKSRKERDAIMKKQEEQQKLFREEEGKRTSSIAEKVAKSKADAQKLAQKPAEALKSASKEVPKEAAEAAKAVPSVDDAAKQAKENAQAARKWIDEWKLGQAGGNGSTAAKEAAQKVAEPVAKAAETVTEKASENGASKNGTSSNPNAEEARKWIEDWRSRSAGKS